MTSVEECRATAAPCTIARSVRPTWWRACAALASIVLALCVAAPAHALEHRFPGLKFTFDAPAGWIVYAVAGAPPRAQNEVFHTELTLADLRDGEYVPVIEFTRPGVNATMSPSISIYATKRGSDDALDRARWVINNIVSLKKSSSSQFELLMAPRQFTTGTLEFEFAEMQYGTVLADGREYGVLDQTFVVDGKELLLVVDVKTAADDSESRSLATDLMKWIKFD